MRLSICRPEIFDEYARRQYVAKAGHRNPFGIEPEPKKFAGFDIFLKLKVLVQLSQWTLNNAERIREKMEERSELEQSRAWVSETSEECENHILTIAAYQ